MLRIKRLSKLLGLVAGQTWGNHEIKYARNVVLSVVIQLATDRDDFLQLHG